MAFATQKRITYLFIDGENFLRYFNENTQKWFGQEVEFDIKKIKDFFNAEKVFYYDCTDEIKTDNENQQQFDKRVKQQKEKHDKILEIEGCHINLGSLRTTKKLKKRTQKEVDVMIAVQMMEHAFRGNMDKAVLLSGDLDFRPLVESMVRLGLFVEVVGDKNHIAQTLIHSADSYKKLTIDEYFKFSPTSNQNQKPINFQTLSFFENRAKEEGFWLERRGKFKDSEINIYTNNQARYHFTASSNILSENSALVGNNINDLILYFELKFGQIFWE